MVGVESANRPELLHQPPGVVDRVSRVGFRPTIPNAEKISITPELLGLIRESVESGEYASTSEALRDAVHIWHRQQLEDAARVAVIRARVRRSIEDPRPSLSETDIDARLTVLFTQAGTASGDAAG